MSDAVQGLLGQLLAWLQVLSSSGSGALDVVQSIDPGLRTAAAGVGSLLEMFVLTGLLVPGDTIVLIVASAVATVPEGALLALAVAVGALVGETASYAFGYWIGSSTRAARFRRGAWEARVSSARRFLFARGGPAILAARFVPGLRTVMPFVVGLSGFPFRRFLAWSVPASFGWAALYVTLYSLAAAPLRDGNGSILLSAGFAMLGFLVFGAAYLVQFLVERAHRDPEEA